MKNWICLCTNCWKKRSGQLLKNVGREFETARGKHDGFGFPYIQVADGDYNGNRELYLKHCYEGTELDMRYARKALEHVHTLWGRPVHLETIVDDESTVLRYDGEEHHED